MYFISRLRYLLSPFLYLYDYLAGGNISLLTVHNITIIVFIIHVVSENHYKIILIQLELIELSKLMYTNN